MATDREILAAVAAERLRQNRKFGQQDRTPEEWIVILGDTSPTAWSSAGEFGEACRGAYEAHFNGASWESYLTELVQVAAVAVAAIENAGRQGLC